MIRDGDPRHYPSMGPSELVMTGDADVSPARADRNRDARITAIVRSEHDFIWRLLRRLGVPASAVDDATQQVFVVASRRVSDIKPGSERSFLFGVALRIAAEKRRSREVRDPPHPDPPDAIDPAPNPEEMADRRQRRALLGEILEAMPLELRTVLVLFELEQMTKTEVAALLEIPVGTAVSRLRRAREEFKALAKRRLRDGAGKANP